MGRIISAGSLCYGQADFYVPVGSFTRPAGILFSNVQLRVFLNNALVSWPVLDGSGVSDASVSAGKIYFNEISGSTGFYAVRFFPDRVGAWRLVLQIPAYAVESVLDFDALPPGVLRPPSGGLIPSTSGC